jgi:DNA mismatch repair ATPase MutL
MTITSRVKAAKEGARLKIEGGVSGKVEKVGVPVGTVVRVEDLFYNVPARLKFLKTDTTEKRAIDSLVTRYALAYPNVRFKVTDGKQITLQTAGDGDRRVILAALYGVDVAKQMLNFGFYQPHFPYSFQSQRDHLFCQRALGAGIFPELGLATGLSHTIDGGTLSAHCVIPRHRSRRCRCKCASHQGGSEI